MDPVAFAIGPLEIRWYGIAMALSMLIGAWIGARLLNKQGYNGESVWDGLVWIIVAGIFGARLFYVLTNLGDYVEHPEEIIAVWHGGLSIHGGVLFGGIATYLFFKSRNIPFFVVADSFVPGVSLGIILVRIGNFMNGDILGYKWNGPFAMNFPFDEYHSAANRDEIILRHPAELYGLMVGVVCLLVAWYMWRRTYIENKLAPGATFFGLLISYSLARSIIEDPFRDVPLPWKVIDPQFYQCGLFTSSQLASIPLILIGIWGLTQIDRWNSERRQREEQGISGGEKLTRQQLRAKLREDSKR
ncbi:prolipoprotein diacylglyceryl transferase [bacterium]|nr:prolipoprotein diacylglyceryl transferase [bacterium]